jgi:hypothetical protein
MSFRDKNLAVEGAAMTNIKGLPSLSDGRKYFTESGYSQSYPWVEIRRTAKTVTLMKVNVKRDPEWKPNIHPGGFCGHCDNQSEQTWLYDGVDEGLTKTVRLVKSRYAGEDYMWAHKGTKFTEDRAVEFYDYNF